MTKDALTPREIEVLRLLARGLSDEQIAVTLTIARGTASNHVSDIIHKLGAANRLAAVVVAVQRGIIAIPPPPPKKGKEHEHLHWQVHAGARMIDVCPPGSQICYWASIPDNTVSSTCGYATGASGFLDVWYNNGWVRQGTVEYDQ